MSGHVFHPGHDELHGVTVVIQGTSGRTYLGRWHERGTRGVTMKNVAIHDPERDTVAVADWLARQRKFGVAAVEQMIIVPPDEAGTVTLFDPTEAP